MSALAGLEAPPSERLLRQQIPLVCKVATLATVKERTGDQLPLHSGAFETLGAHPEMLGSDPIIADGKQH